MKKNAFTLVELLAVLVVLGIISGITIPVINKSIISSRNSLYKDQEQIILKASINWAETNTDKLPTEENKTIALSLGYLKAEGFLTGNLKNPNTGYLYPDNMIVNVSFDQSNDRVSKHNIKYNGDYRFEFDESSGTDINMHSNIPAITLNICGGGDNFSSEAVVKCQNDNLSLIIPDDLKEVIVYDQANNLIDQSKLVEYQYENITYNLFDMSKYGFYYLSYTYNNKTNTDYKLFLINDTEVPILILPDQNTFSIDDEIDLTEGVSCTDNSGYCSIKVLGNITPGIEGKYVIKYIVSDESGNTVRANRVINLTK